MIDDLITITRKAHQEILDVYNSNFVVETKTDISPITDADRRAHDVIMEGLLNIDASIPVLSEEGDIPAFDVRRRWNKYWIVDPIDGTRGFTKKNDEFTVNIALIEQGSPKIGVVGIPTQKIVYSGEVERRLALRHTPNDSIPISSSPPGELIQMTSSRHSATLENQKIIDYLTSMGGNVSVIVVGSSIKMCFIAEGKADLYVRFGPTNEWDIAAAHAVLNAAGGGLYLLDGKHKIYNQSESTKNPAFFACGTRPDEWMEALAAAGVLAEDN